MIDTQKRLFTTREGTAALHILRGRETTPACNFVALHGFTGSGLDFECLAHLIGGTWYCPDWPGHGESPAPEYRTQPEFYSLANHLDSISHAIDLARADGVPVVLLGYSMGGRLALQWAINNPSTLRGLILVGTSPGLADASERQARQQSDQALAEKICADGVHAFLRRWQRLPLMESQSAIPEPWKSSWFHRRTNNSATGLSGSLLGVGTGVLPPLHCSLSELVLPTLLVVGENDTKFCQIMREMHTHLPFSEFHAIPAVGHAAHVEAPYRFAELVADFLLKN